MNTTTTPRRVTGAATVASAVLLFQSLVWLVRPDLNPYVDPNLAQLRTVLPLSAHSWLLAVLALTGLVCAGIATLRPDDPAAGRVVRTVAPVVTLGLFAATATMSGISFAGYLVGMALPFAAIVVGIIAAVRSRRARLPLGLGLVVGIIVMIIFRDLIAGALRNNLAAFARMAPTMWALILTLTTIAFWAVLSIRGLRSSRLVESVTPWLVRHRRPITVLAAIGPLPYSVVRLTWLTPWPVGGAPDGSDVTTAWGLMLSLGGWLGAILTLGLILPWGERLPTWMPRIGGRPVPPAAAIVPGSIVAGLVCLAAVPWTLSFAQEPSTGFAVYFFLLPFGYWGVMLALAVWAYAGHRARPEAVPTEPIVPADARPDTMAR